MINLPTAEQHKDSINKLSERLRIYNSLAPKQQEDFSPDFTENIKRQVEELEFRITLY